MGWEFQTGTLPQLVMGHGQGGHQEECDICAGAGMVIWGVCICARDEEWL